MTSARSLAVFSAICFSLTACDRHHNRKPDPTKGRVTGIVICADTGKPARFASVTLTAAPSDDAKFKPDDPLPSIQTVDTDLDGRFTMEAVDPGHYYAFARLNGYLDPEVGIDFTHLDSLANDRERELNVIRQWKDHLLEVTVALHRSSAVTLELVRSAEIAGTVTYDDGSPAIGVHFQLFRKTAKDAWSSVGLSLFNDWSISTVSDSHGRYLVTNLPAGEYSVCALLPADDQDAALHVCLGNTFRRRDATSVKVTAGETLPGADIVIPLSGLRTIEGNVTALADGHVLGKGSASLLFADNRDKARQVAIQPDGSFEFDYVPDGKYILAISAGDADPPGDAAPPAAAPVHYLDKETPLTVINDMDDVSVVLLTAPPADSAPQPAQPPAPQ